MLHGEADGLKNSIAVTWFVSDGLTRVTQLVTLHFLPVISAQGYTEEQGHGPEELSHCVILYLQ